MNKQTAALATSIDEGLELYETSIKVMRNAIVDQDWATIRAVTETMAGANAAMLRAAVSIEILEQLGPSLDRIREELGGSEEGEAG